MEQGLTRQRIISELTKSEHGNLGSYVKVGAVAAQEQTEFFAHLVSWNHEHGSIRDAKTALPVLALNAAPEPELAENALAHIMSLDPRNLLRALDFSHGYFYVKTKPVKGKKTPPMKKERVGGVRISYKLLHRAVARYLAEREKNAKVWELTVIKQRDALRKLYLWADVAAGGSGDHYMSRVLFHREYPAGSAFEAVKNLREMSANQAVQAINKFDIPILVALPVLGDKLKDTGVALEVIKAMSPAELQNNLKLFEKFGWKTVPALRAALDEKLAEARAAGKNVLKHGSKTGYVEKNLGADLAAKMRVEQEKQIDEVLRIKGNWLILGDASPSMNVACEASKEAAAIMARAVEGKTHVIFFDAQPRYADLTGKSYEEVKHVLRNVKAGGSGTSIGVGLAYMVERGEQIDGIAILSDAQENSAPRFADVYNRYVDKQGNTPAVYLYRFQPGTRGYRDIDLAQSMAQANLEMTEFDLRAGFDEYSLPNLIKTMRPGRFALLDEIMSSPLRRLNDVLPNTANMEVFIDRSRHAEAVGR